MDVPDIPNPNKKPDSPIPPKSKPQLKTMLRLAMYVSITLMCLTVTVMFPIFFIKGLTIYNGNVPAHTTANLALQSQIVDGRYEDAEEDPIDPDFQASIVESIEDTAEEIENQLPVADTGSDVAYDADFIDTNYTCPKYDVPTMPKLPRLPPESVLQEVDRDQLIVILWQHIQEQQKRTKEVRKRFYTSYSEYEKTCQ